MSQSKRTTQSLKELYQQYKAKTERPVSDAEVECVSVLAQSTDDFERQLRAGIVTPSVQTVSPRH